MFMQLHAGPLSSCPMAEALLWEFPSCARVRGLRLGTCGRSCAPHSPQTSTRVGARAPGAHVVFCACAMQGQQPPEPPPLPDFKPTLDRGAHLFVRETLVTTVRRIYEHIAVAKLTPQKSEAILRDSKVWIKNVLSVRHRKDPLTTKLYKYQFAILHSNALFYAADCTVAIGYHTYATCKLPKGMHNKDKALYWIKGAGMQILRCTTTLLAVSVTASLGSLAKPGTGTLLAQIGTDIAIGVAFNIWIASVLEGR